MDLSASSSSPPPGYEISIFQWMFIFAPPERRRRRFSQESMHRKQHFWQILRERYELSYGWDVNAARNKRLGYSGGRTSTRTNLFKCGFNLFARFGLEVWQSKMLSLEVGIKAIKTGKNSPNNSTVNLKKFLSNLKHHFVINIELLPRTSTYRHCFKAH